MMTLMSDLAEAAGGKHKKNRNVIKGLVRSGNLRLLNPTHRNQKQMTYRRGEATAGCNVGYYNMHVCNM